MDSHGLIGADAPLRAMPPAVIVTAPEGATWANATPMPSAPDASPRAEGGVQLDEALRDIAAGEELLQCYLMLGSESDDGSTREWGFECDCGRCTGAASTRELEVFDGAHVCVCGCVTTASMRQACMAAGGLCQCHERNRVASQEATESDMP